MIADAPQVDLETLLHERDELAERVRHLEDELVRYRAHAQRTSKLFLAVTHYAEWVRESARRDAEITLRKARARAAKLDDLARERELAEQELARLKALAGETRTQLESLVGAAIQALGDGTTSGPPKPATVTDDLHETLRGEIGSSSWESRLLTHSEARDR